MGNKKCTAREWNLQIIIKTNTIIGESTRYVRKVTIQELLWLQGNLAPLSSRTGFAGQNETFKISSSTTVCYNGWLIVRSRHFDGLYFRSATWEGNVSLVKVFRHVPFIENFCLHVNHTLWIVKSSRNGTESFKKSVGARRRKEWMAVFSVRRFYPKSATNHPEGSWLWLWTKFIRCVPIFFELLFTMWFQINWITEYCVLAGSQKCIEMAGPHDLPHCNTRSPLSSPVNISFCPL